MIEIQSLDCEIIFFRFRVNQIGLGQVTNNMSDPTRKLGTLILNEEQHIPKFVIDYEVEVMQFLKKFSDVNNLESLAKCLNENQINMSNTSNDLIYVWMLLDQFFFMYKNDILLQSMFKCKLKTYIWTPLIKMAFFGKSDMKLSCGELVASNQCWPFYRSSYF